MKKPSTLYEHLEIMMDDRLTKKVQTFLKTRKTYRETVWGDKAKNYFEEMQIEQDNISSSDKFRMK